MRSNGSIQNVAAPSTLFCSLSAEVGLSAGHVADTAETDSTTGTGQNTSILQPRCRGEDLSFTNCISKSTGTSTLRLIYARIDHDFVAM